MDVKLYGADCALVSTPWNWGPYYVDAVKRVMNKTWKPQEIFWGFQEILIVLSPFHPSVPKTVQDKVLAEMKKMKEGKDDSFLGPLKDQSGKVMIAAGQRATDKELLTMKWFTEGVVGQIPQCQERSQSAKSKEHRANNVRPESGMVWRIGSNRGRAATFFVSCFC